MGCTPTLHALLHARGEDGTPAITPAPPHSFRGRRRLDWCEGEGEGEGLGLGSGSGLRLGSEVVPQPLPQAVSLEGLIHVSN